MVAMVVRLFYCLFTFKPGKGMQNAQSRIQQTDVLMTAKFFLYITKKVADFVFITN